MGGHGVTGPLVAHLVDVALKRVFRVGLEVVLRPHETHFGLIEEIAERARRVGVGHEPLGPVQMEEVDVAKLLEDAVGLACESAAARQVARQFGLAASTVRAVKFAFREALFRVPTCPLKSVGRVAPITS